MGGPGHPTDWTDDELALPAGRLHARRLGPADGPLVICVPGLSSNSRAFAALGRRVAPDGRHVVALD
ncbi:MAG: hypothetical protein M3296_06140, partial [Actinomycetota bacterium]|nr:hypothetical protein [Actinomycetota bacterium]